MPAAVILKSPKNYLSAGCETSIATPPILLHPFPVHSTDMSHSSWFRYLAIDSTTNSRVHNCKSLAAGIVLGVESRTCVGKSTFVYTCIMEPADGGLRGRYNGESAITS